MDGDNELIDKQRLAASFRVRRQKEHQLAVTKHSGESVGLSIWIGRGKWILSEKNADNEWAGEYSREMLNKFKISLQSRPSCGRKALVFPPPQPLMECGLGEQGERWRKDKERNWVDRKGNSESALFANYWAKKSVPDGVPSCGHRVAGGTGCDCHYAVPSAPVPYPANSHKGSLHYSKAKQRATNGSEHLIENHWDHPNLHVFPKRKLKGSRKAFIVKQQLVQFRMNQTIAKAKIHPAMNTKKASAWALSTKMFSRGVVEIILVIRRHQEYISAHAVARTLSLSVPFSRTLLPSSIMTLLARRGKYSLWC